MYFSSTIELHNIIIPQLEISIIVNSKTNIILLTMNNYNKIMFVLELTIILISSCGMIILCNSIVLLKYMHIHYN